MIYQIKQKVWNFSKFSILDNNENEKFLVKGKIFSFVKQFSFQDPLENELAHIKQKIWSWKTRYEIFIGGTLHSEIIKEWTWFKMKLTINVVGEEPYIIKGDFFGHEYQILKNEETVATISKKVWAWSDTYAVNISKEENDIPILCYCIVIDAIMASKKRGNTD